MYIKIHDILPSDPEILLLEICPAGILTTIFFPILFVALKN